MQTRIANYYSEKSGLNSKPNQVNNSQSQLGINANDFFNLIQRLNKIEKNYEILRVENKGLKMIVDQSEKEIDLIKKRYNSKKKEPREFVPKKEGSSQKSPFVEDDILIGIGASAQAKEVFSGLRRFRYGNEFSYPSQQQLGDYVYQSINISKGAKKTRVRRGLKELEKLSVIKIKHNFIPGTKIHKHNKYYFNIDFIDRKKRGVSKIENPVFTSVSERGLKIEKKAQKSTPVSVSSLVTGVTSKSHTNKKEYYNKKHNLSLQKGYKKNGGKKVSHESKQIKKTPLKENEKRFYLHSKEQKITLFNFLVEMMKYQLKKSDSDLNFKEPSKKEGRLFLKALDQLSFSGQFGEVKKNLLIGETFDYLSRYVLIKAYDLLEDEGKDQKGKPWKEYFQFDYLFQPEKVLKKDDFSGRYERLTLEDIYGDKKPNNEDFNEELKQTIENSYQSLPKEQQTTCLPWVKDLDLNDLDIEEIKIEEQEKQEKEIDSNQPFNVFEQLKKHCPDKKLKEKLEKDDQIIITVENSTIPKKEKIQKTKIKDDSEDEFFKMAMLQQEKLNNSVKIENSKLSSIFEGWKKNSQQNKKT